MNQRPPLVDPPGPVLFCYGRYDPPGVALCRLQPVTEALAPSLAAANYPTRSSSTVDSHRFPMSDHMSIPWMPLLPWFDRALALRDDQADDAIHMLIECEA